MRNWVNLYELLDKECPHCGTIPSQVIDKPLKSLYTKKQKRERRKKYGNLVMCKWCCQAIADPPKGMVTEKKVRRPRGWKFMKEFVDSEGNVFQRGVEKPKLKGTKKPTDLDKLKKERKEKKKKKEKFNKWQKEEKRHEIATKIHHIKEEIKKLQERPRTKSKVKAKNREIRKLNQELKKWI